MRKLATLQQIEALVPIEGADKIEKATIKGWNIVVGKGLYQKGSWVVFHEIDAAFRVGQEPYHSDLEARGTKECQLENGAVIKAYVIKSIKLRGVVSQGYCVPLTSYSLPVQQKFHKNLKKDFDVTQLLDVLKYEKPEVAEPAVKEKPPKGKFNLFKFKARKWLERHIPTLFKPAPKEKGFPTWIKKTEAVRIQNYVDEMYEKYQTGTLFNVSYKIDGSSITAAKKDKKLYACSRNLSKNIKETTNSFVRNSLIIHDKLKKVKGDYCLQGELVAPNIQSNFENVKQEEVYIFSMWNIEKQQLVNPLEVVNYCKQYNIPHVPILHEAVTLKELFPNITSKEELLAELLKYAEGPSGLNGKYREGLVYKECVDGYLPIKTISNSYLLKKKD